MVVFREALAHLRFKSGRRESSSHNRDRTTVQCLAKALDDRSRCTLLSFYSPKCELCKRVRRGIDAVAEEEDWLNLVRLDVEDQTWIPEVSYYSVDNVPCLVLLDKRGRARFKTAVPKSEPLVLESFAHLLQEGRLLQR